MGGWKRALAAAGAAVLTASLLSGCAAGGRNTVWDDGENAAEPETYLTFFGFKYEALNVAAIENALHGYMEAYPGVSISYDGIKGLDYYDVLEKRLSTGNGDDIFMVDHERVLELGARGLLADLSGLSTLESFSDLAKSQMAAGGAVYYVPTSISAFGLYCNLDLLAEHGQKVPEDLEEFREVCDAFVAEGIVPIVANNDISLKTVAIAKAMLPTYQSADPAAAIARFNSGETDLAETLHPGFALVEEMLQKGWVDAGEALETEKTRDDLTLFAAGARPFMLTGAWAAPRLRELEPDFRFEVRPYPILEDGSVLVINVDTRISVNAGSPHVEQAKDFVEYMTQKDVVREFVESQASFSPLADSGLAGDAAVQPIGPYLNNGRSVLGADDNLRLPIWDLTRQCVVGMLEGGGAADAAAQMRAEILAWEEAEKEDSAQ